jgi:rhodanese-related sulfurtransferase
MVRGDAILLLDVREQWEREIADLPEYGQVHMPLNDLVFRHGQLDREAEIVVYCRSGACATTASAMCGIWPAGCSAGVGTWILR